MANPATLLHQQLSKWNQINQTADQARQPALDQWVTQRLMVRHLDAIDEMLRTLEANGRNVGVYRRTFPAWCQAVFVFPQGWSAGNSGGINEQHLGHLETLAERLDGELPVADDDGLERLSGYLVDVRQLLSEDGSLPSDLRDHIAQVVTHVEWCISNYAIAGDFEVRVASERLIAVLAEGRTQSGDKKLWDGLLTRFAWPFASEVAVGIASSAATLALGG